MALQASGGPYSPCVGLPAQVSRCQPEARSRASSTDTDGNAMKVRLSICTNGPSTRSAKSNIVGFATAGRNSLGSNSSVERSHSVGSLCPSGVWRATMLG